MWRIVAQASRLHAQSIRHEVQAGRLRYDILRAGWAMRNLALLMLVLFSVSAWAVTPSQDEIDAVAQWVRASLVPTGALPFSFTYAG